jgi:hypothetical protein
MYLRRTFDDKEEISMRHTSALSKLKSLSLVVAGLFLALGPNTAHAQVFNDIDFNLDRGAFSYTFPNGAARRLGYNNFTRTTPDPNSALTGTQPLQDDPNNNNPGYGVRRWTWPATADLTNNGEVTYTCDSPYPGVGPGGAVFPYNPPNGIGKATFIWSNGQQPDDAIVGGDWPANATSVNPNFWIIPPQANRVPNGGFTFQFDNSVEYTYDYGYAAAQTVNFTYVNAANTNTQATINDLIPLPYIPHAIYKSVFNTLTTGNFHPVARWSMGSYNTIVTGFAANGNPITTHTPIPSGDYHIRIWSPGSGTKIPDTTGTLFAHPNVYHAFVQVSYINTVNGNNTFNLGVAQPGNVNQPWKPGAGGINDPIYSRIFMIDLSQQGWHDVQANATALNNQPTAPALFPYNAPLNYNPNVNPQVVPNQIVVTLYAVTPDDVTDTTLFSTYPLVTANAVQFIRNNTNDIDVTQLTNPTLQAAEEAAMDLGPVQANGRILGPIVSTNKFTDPAHPNDPINGVVETPGSPAFPSGNGVTAHRPLFFLAREETFPYSEINPTIATATPIDPTVQDLILATDPNHTITRPVFYCLGAEEEAIPNPLYPGNNNLPKTIAEPTYRRIRWRYIGMPDTGGGTASASPLIANVRCRDGKTRSMVFFVTTSQDGSLGHIYAFDPIGYNPTGGDPNSTPTEPNAAGDRGLVMPTIVSPVTPQAAPPINNYYQYFVNPQPGDDGINAMGQPIVPGVTDTITNGVLTESALTKSALLLPSRTTRCYWIYPSLRPSLHGLLDPTTNLPLDPLEPAGGVPNEWHDPNYTVPVPALRQTDTGPAAFYPLGTFGADDPAPIADQAIPYYDGDVVNDSSAPSGMSTRTDTKLRMGGLTAAPMILDDPNNLAGPQILVVTGGGSAGVTGINTNQGLFGGHVYAFDAGGRGDYSDTKFMPTLSNTTPGAASAVANPAEALDPTQPPVTIPGTTQRLWTWPHLGIDAFHRIHNADKNYSAPYTIQDETLRGNFVNSPAYDPDYPTVPTLPLYKPIFVPSDDGHLYAVLPFHDIYLGTSSNVASYDNTQRIYWSFPNANLGSSGGAPAATLGNSPSTPAIFQASSGNRYIYFTCDLPGDTGNSGRVYSIPEAPIIGNRTGSVIPFANLTWVFPYSPNWPYEDPNNASNTSPLSPGFTTSAPVAINSNFNNMFQFLGTGATLPYDMVYVTMNDGTVVGLQAEPGGATPAYNTVLYGVGGTQADTFVTGHTLCTPMVSYIEPNPNLNLLTGLNDPNYDQNNQNYTTSYPALLYTDDDGNLYGVGLLESNDGSTPPVTPPNGILPTIYYYGETQNIRDAAVILSNAWLAQGDHGGQVHAYSVGNRGAETTDTVPSSEPASYANTGSGNVAIDIRTVDFYTQAAINTFMLTPNSQNAANASSPGFTDQGSTTHQVNPFILTPPLDNRGGVAADWGEYLYVAAWGVYHSAPSRGLQLRGDSEPRIDVTFNVTQNNSSVSQQITVPAIPVGNGVGKPPWAGLVPPDDGFPDPINPNNANALPGDYGYNGNAANLSIAGIDPNTSNPVGDTNPRILTGPSDHVYPWVAVYKIRVVPDQRSSYQPGAAGLRVSARARITQTVQDVHDPMNLGTPTQDQAETLPMLAGQHDYNGNQNLFGLPQNPNNRALRGRTRPVYIANPIALTVRSYFQQAFPDMTGLPNVIGWGGSLFKQGVTYNDPADMFGNGSQIGVGNSALGQVTVAAAEAESFKSLYAPIDLAQDGTTQTYTAATDNTGTTRAPAIFVMDRTNLSMETGAPLRIQANLDGYKWHGDVTSVMNPLPWEQLPDDIRTTSDYPALSNRNAHLVSKSNLDLTLGSALSLIAPLQPTNSFADRVPQPTEVDLSLDIPKYFPANVNRGFISYKDQKTGKTYSFGSNYMDDAGYVRGNTNDPASSVSLMGPLSTGTGLPIGGPSNVTYPAGGYITHMRVTAVRPGANGRPVPGRTTNQAVYRNFESGISVAPTIRLHTQEETLDFGKEPSGTGYSTTVAGSQGYQFPFEPSGMVDFPNPNVPSPWDDPTQFGSFFLPFTLVSESNINLIDVRIAKLYGQPGASIDARSLTNDINGNLFNSGVAIATGLTSQDVNNLLLPPLPAIAFGRNTADPQHAPGTGLGNIGIISSYDHGQANPTVGILGTSERSLYPIPNPAVDGNAASEATALYNGNTNNFLLDLWPQGIQPRPSLHKPLIGAAQGSTATVPDVPGSAQGNQVVISDASGNLTTFTAGSPKIGVAIPIGTPAGTYTAKVYPYEDNTPIQWREWLVSSLKPTVSNMYDLNSQDGIFNESANGAPLETPSDTALNLKVLVRENRLTGGTTRGSQPQIDAANAATLYNRDKMEISSPIALGFNVLPTVLPIPTLDAGQQIFLYWATNRQANNNYTVSVVNKDGNPTNVPLPNAPVNLAYSALQTPYNPIQIPNGPKLMFPDVLFSSPTNYWNGANLFGGKAVFSGLPGLPIPNTLRFGSPNAALANHVLPTGAYQKNDLESYLVWYGQVEKKQNVNGIQQTVTETRTFYTTLTNGVPSNAVPASFLNDPSITKLGPKPLLAKFENENRGGVNLAAIKMLYVFWYAGANAHTSLYYNANVTGLNSNFDQTGWDVPNGLGDQKLSIPDVLTWESDPHPVLRRVIARDPFNSTPSNAIYRTYDAIDVFYTGVLRNRQKVEILMSRYGINRGEHPNLKLGQLFLLDLPRVTNEQMGHSGTGSSYTTRDVGWNVNATYNAVQIYLQRNGAPTATLLDTTVTTPVPDKASGLMYSNLTTGPLGGGRMALDTQSGNVSFPNIPPQGTDRLFVSYTPLVMRINTARDGSNAIDGIDGGTGVDTPRPNNVAPGDNSQPTAILDRGDNPRASLTNPQVAPAGMPIDRLWVLYHKSDFSGTLKSNVYYKPMRLMVRLPYSVALGNNGVQQTYNLFVNPASGGRAVGPYEVDWARGRIYFTEQDEGNLITVTYTAWTGTSTVAQVRTYQVSWGDELSVTGSTPDQTTDEVPLPTDQAVNEGQVTAFKDPLIDKLWVFWSSTRGGVPDLFFETIAPQFYPQVTNQQ